MTVTIPADAPPPPYPKTIEIKIRGEIRTVPICPEDIDVSHYDHMPLNVKRLFGSELFLSAPDAGFKAAVTLWCRAWHQVPAASLPADERQLCQMAGYGKDMRSWAKIRKYALHGFELASDGRKYHAVLAEIALNSYKNSRRQSAKSKTRWELTQDVENNKDQSMPGDSSGIEPGIPPGISPKNPGEVRGGEVKEVKKERDGESAPETPPQPTRAPEPAKAAPDAKSGPPAQDTDLGGPTAPPKRGTRLPADWKPDETLIAYGKNLGFTTGQLERINASFAAFWQGQSGAKATKQDWPATYRSWLLREDPAKVREMPVNSAQPNSRFGETLHHGGNVTEAQWQARLAGYKRTKRWPITAGFVPEDPRCEAPLHLLVEYGFRKGDAP